MKREKNRTSNWSDKNRRILIAYDERHLVDLDPETIKEEDRAIYTLLTLYPEHGKYFSKELPKTDHCTQEQFANIFRISQARVSQLLARRVLTPAMPWRIWAVQYLSYLKGAAAGARGTAILW